jgi:hypothetical protein
LCLDHGLEAYALPGSAGHPRRRSSATAA